jgi:uncharacterized membrane protein
MIEWSRPYPLWLYLLAGLALAVLLLAARRLAISPRLRSWLVLVPRAGALALLLVILLNPVWREEVQLPSEPAQVCCLVDASRSMALDRPVSRADQARQTLQSIDAALTGADRPRLQLYRFGAQLSLAGDLAQLAPTDDASQLAAALEQLPSRFSRQPPRAAIVFSDGAVPDAERLAEVAAAYRKLEIPIHVVPLGDPRLRGDLAIQDLVVPRRAEAGARVPVRAVIRCQGYAGQRVVVEVRPADRPQSEPLVALPVTLDDGEQPVELVVEANPDHGRLRLTIAPQEGEISDENNAAEFQLVERRRKIKVIYMEGTVGSEYQWVRDALLEDQDIECLPMTVDAQYVERPRLARIDDPYRGFPTTREELLGYDCVICSDISQGAFTKEQLDWVVELVGQRGGGFAMVGGHTSFGSGGWDQTVWDQLIPVDMQGGVQGQGWAYQQFTVAVPEEAQTHPIWRIVEDPAQNRQVLERMPPFLGTNYVQRLKPAATVLGVSREEITGMGFMTIFACESYGRGRTFAFAPDSTVDWGRYFESQWGEGDNRYFRRFWRNVVRWLTENSASGSRRLRIETDRIIYRAGQPIAVEAQAFDEQLEPTIDYELTARLVPTNAAAAPPATEAERRSVPLGATASDQAYRGELPATAWFDGATATAAELQGVAAREVEVIATHQGHEIARATTRVQLLADSPELRQPVPQPDNLELLAEASGGRVLSSPREAVEALSALPVREGDVLVARSPLWDSPWLWGAVLGLLGLEWTLRRRAGFG